jgi:hypothetical protein
MSINIETVLALREDYVTACTIFQEADAAYNAAQIDRQVKHRKMNDAMAALNAELLPEFNKPDPEPDPTITAKMKEIAEGLFDAEAS